MSSRNIYLSEAERRDALSLSQALAMAERLIMEGERDAGRIRAAILGLIEAKSHTSIDYVEIVDGETLKPVREISGKILIALAIFVGKTRLIDNVILEV